MNRRNFVKNVAKGIAVAGSVAGIAVGSTVKSPGSFQKNLDQYKSRFPDDEMYVAIVKNGGLPNFFIESLGCLNKTTIAGVPAGQLLFIGISSNIVSGRRESTLTFKRRHAGWNYFLDAKTRHYVVLSHRDTGQPAYASCEFRDIPGLATAKLVRINKAPASKIARV